MAKKKSVQAVADQATQDEATAEAGIEKSPTKKEVKAKVEKNPAISQEIEATVALAEETQEADKAAQNGMPKAFKKLQSRMEKVEQKLKKLTKQGKKKK